MAAQDETTETPAFQQDPLIGEVIGGKYRVIGPLAKGGMARIYRAEQEPLKRIVALKALAPQDAGDTGARFEDRFYLEASTCAKLKHPNTVTLFDYGFHAKTETYYMIMELVEGRSLAKAVRDEGSFHPARAVAIAIEICRSLQEAHGLGIVHRDLKPSNVMLVDTLEGEAVKVLDFGIAKVLQEGANQSITVDDRIVGSPRYMAPEQISQGEIDGRTDVYAVGIILFEMITGAPPFSGTTAIQTLMKHLNEPVPALRSMPGHAALPAELEAVLLKCMAKSRSDRHASIEALRNALRDVLPHVTDASIEVGMSTESLVRHIAGVVSPRTETTQPTMDRPFEETFTRSTPVVLGGLTVLGMSALVVLLGGAALLYVGWDRPGTDVPVAEPVELAVQAVATPVLRIGSVPEGAMVMEGDRVLGTTPLEVPLPPGQASPRRFELKLDGYQPYLVEQGSSAQDVMVLADLVAVPAPAPAPAAAAPKPAKPAPKPNNPDLEILDAR